MQIEKLKKMTTKQKQIFAAKCFAHFCTEKGIIHNSIDKLIEHLMSIETAEDIVNWEQKGTQLKLVGRGDLIPEKINTLIPQKDRVAFNELLDSTVEVGIVDMYGEETEKPILFLKKCISILEKNNIELPEI